MHSTRDFLEAVLSPDGLPCLGWLNGTGGFHHYVFPTLEDFCTTAARIRGDKGEMYFCVSTLKDKQIQTQLANGQAKTQVRTQKNASHSKTFVLDVDIKPDNDKFCQSREQAMADIQTAVEVFSLPRPLVVNSGNGLHVYWPMEQAIPSIQWTATAQQFKKALQLTAPRLVADGTRVADCAGVLRLPNTVNHKGGEAKPVEIIQWHDGWLDFKAFSNALSVVAAPIAVKSTVTPVASTPTPPVPLMGVAKNCNWVRQYLRTKDKASEPEWYAMLGLVPYLTHPKGDDKLEGAPLAHAISKGHPGYSFDQTSKKFQQVQAAQSGPTTCQRMQDIDPSHCEGCPFREVVKTPLQAGRLSKPVTEPVTVTTIVHEQGGVEAEEEITIPVPPEPYFRGESGGVFVRAQEKNKQTKEWQEVIHKVYDYDLYLTRRVRGETTSDERLEVHLWLPKEGLVKFWLATELLADPRALAKALFAKGVIAEAENITRLVRYFIDYARHLQTMQEAQIEFGHFGWRAPLGEKPKFVLANEWLDCKGRSHPSVAAPPLRDAAKAVAAKGSLQKWSEAFDVYRRIPGMEPYIFTAMLGFAAPLMAMTEYHGVLFNLIGPSAAGKSTALKFMTSVFGAPNPQHLLVTDTDISVYNEIGYLSNLAVAFDEVTKMPEQRLGNFVLNFTGGRGKNRAMKSGENKLNEVTWQTIVACTSNTSLYDKAAAARRGYNAEAMRIYEVQVNPPSLQHKATIDAATDILRTNYGAAGPVYAAYLLRNAKPIKITLDAAMAAITRKFNLGVEERFWAALMACVYVGGAIANEKLGLHQYDMTKLLDWAKGSSEDAMESVVSEVPDAISTVAEFCNANVDSIVRVNQGAVDAAQTATMRKISGRAERLLGGECRLWVSTSVLRNWCNAQNIDPNWIVRELKRHNLLLESRQTNLAKGTRLLNMYVRCLCIDFTDRKDNPPAVFT